MAENSTSPSYFAFQAKVTCNGTSYDAPLFGSDFIELDDDILLACDILTQRNVQMEHGRVKDADFSRPEYYLKKAISIDKLHVSCRRNLQNVDPEYQESWRALQESYKLHGERKVDWVQHELALLNVMRQTYYYCLDAKQQTDKRAIQHIFTLLSAASFYRKARLLRVEQELSFISPKIPEIHEIDQHLIKIQKSIRNPFTLEWYCNQEKEKEKKQLEAFQIADVFDGFCEKYGKKYRIYSLAFPYVKKKINRKVIAHPKASSFDFWENPNCQEELRNDFWGYCLTVSDRTAGAMLGTCNVEWLAGQLQDALDQQLMERVKESKPVISTKDATVYWEAPDGITAEYLCLYRDLMTSVPYRVCPICKSIFRVDGRQKLRQHCSRHNRKQIDYFHRVQKQIGAESAPTIEE